jgi:hypothetical protein
MAQTGCAGLSSPVTTQLTISGSACSWTGPLIISGTGSLVLQNSSLVINDIVNYTTVYVSSQSRNVTAVNTFPGYISLNGSASLVLEGNSAVRSYALGLNQTSKVSVTGGALLNISNNVYQQYNSHLVMNVTKTAPGILALLDSSTFTVSGASKVLAGFLQLGAVSSISVTGGSSIFLGKTVTEPYYAGSFSMDSSTLTASGNSTFAIGGTSVSVTKSVVSVSGFLSAALGGTTTTISQDRLNFVNDVKVALGSNGTASTTTISSGSSISVQDLTNSANMPKTGGVRTYIFGNQLLSVTNSNISCALSTSAVPFKVSYTVGGNTISHTDYPNSTLAFIGGTVGILSSQITSSARELYGFQPSSLSVLTVNASSTLTVKNSQLFSGQNSLLGTFANSALTLRAQGDDNVTQSLIQSEAITQSLQVESESPTGTNVLSLVQDKLETGPSNGLVALRSSYLATLDRTFVDANATGLNFKAFAFRFTAVDSILNVQNISQSQAVFGSTVAVGDFINTTISNCPGLTCLKSTGTGSYSVFEYLNVHVIGANSQALAGATVTATSPRIPYSTYTSVTDQNGWARFLALIQYGNGTHPASPTAYYVLQGLDAGLTSPQTQLALTGNLTSQLQLLLPSVNFTGAGVVGKSVSTIASDYNLVVYPHLIPPAGQYALGNYIGTQYIPYFYVLSNAVPLAFRNNATNNEIDFNTLGATGSEYRFVLIYPSNLTQISLGLRVDGNTTVPLTRLSNSTTSFVMFSIPSGVHTVGLTYLPPNGNYAGGIQYPKFFPPLTTIIVVLVVLAAGLGFAILFVRTREKRFRTPVP